MKARIIILILFFLALFVLFHRETLKQYEKVHKPMSIHPYNESTQTGYVLGQWKNRPKVPISFTQTFTYKKINNYIFSHYNIYTIEIAFVDFVYTTALDVKVWAEDLDIHVTQHLGFHLDNQKIDGLNLFLEKANFKLITRQYVDEKQKQTITTFNLTLKNGDTKIDANLTHILRNDQCFTLFRPKNIISHKCYGGYGDGKANMEHYDDIQGRKRFNVYHLTKNLTRVGLDILRGPGMKWQFVWIEALGFNKLQFYAQNHTIQIQKWIGLNFGSLNGMGQDFLFWNSKIFAIQGLKYQFDQNHFQKDTIIHFTSESPRMDLTYKIYDNHHAIKDMTLVMVDMKRAYGFFQGWIEIDGQKHQFNLLGGLIEVSNSIF